MSIVPSDTSLAALFSLVPEQLPEAYAWEDDLKPIVAEKKGRMAALDRLADLRGLPVKTVRKKFYAYQKDGIAGLIDRRKASALWNGGNTGLSLDDQELVKTWIEKFQRKKRPAISALLRAWRTQTIPQELAARGLSVPHTMTPLDPLSGYPMGWSPRNLDRYAPSDYELKAVRIGKTAAHRSLVYTTRRNYYVGQYFLWDDMWHDHEVMDLDQKRRGRPLEFHGLDLKSAYKFAWGTRTRVLRADGTHEGLKEGDFRFLYAAALASYGFHPDGTTNIVEHGTTKLPEEVERLLFDQTGGLIRFERGGMQGAAAHAGQYLGRPKGNFKVKAALESLGNLIHNELAALPGQTGMNRLYAPEEQHGRQRHTDALICALSQLPEERIAWLQWDYCTIQQFRLILDELYARLNDRKEHELEGWDELYVPDRATGRMRRMSPKEVWTPGARRLVPIDPATLALVIGTEHGVELTTRNGMLTMKNGEISGDPLRFDASLLPDREKFLAVMNPFDPSRIFVFDAHNAFVDALPRIWSVDRSEEDAVRRAQGAALKAEAEALAPLRRRHLAEARVNADRAKNNAAVLRGATAKPAEDPDEETPAVRRGAGVNAELAAYADALRDEEV